jgi:translation initiation factor IF-3
LKNIKPEKIVQPINENIRFPRVQLITGDGQNVGVVSREEALRSAHLAGLDLVLIAEKGGEGYPVTKIMDFGKLLYAKKKKQSEAKKHQKTIQVKEIKLRPKIGEHDFLTKMNQSVQFLKDGKHLKVTVAFRGREIITKEERGSVMFDKINKFLEENDMKVGVNLIQEKDLKMGQLWSRTYYMKSGK